MLFKKRMALLTISIILCSVIFIFTRKNENWNKEKLLLSLNEYILEDGYIHLINYNPSINKIEYTLYNKHQQPIMFDSNSELEVKIDQNWYIIEKSDVYPEINISLILPAQHSSNETHFLSWHNLNNLPKGKYRLIKKIQLIEDTAIFPIIIEEKIIASEFTVY